MEGQKKTVTNGWVLVCVEEMFHKMLFFCDD